MTFRVGGALQSHGIAPMALGVDPPLRPDRRPPGEWPRDGDWGARAPSLLRNPDTASDGSATRLGSHACGRSGARDRPAPRALRSAPPWTPIPARGPATRREWMPPIPRQSPLLACHWRGRCLPFRTVGPFAQTDSLASRPLEDAGQPPHQRGRFHSILWHTINLPESRGDGPRLREMHSVSFSELR